MDKDYKHYTCPICGCEFSIYIVTIKARECNPYSGSEQCMGARKYKRNGHGAMEQDG